MKKETRNFKAAKYYARQGWENFPVHWPAGQQCSCGRQDCDSVGKHPLTVAGAKDGTRDLQQIAEWWDRWPQANVGINVGRSSLIVIDIDPGHGGRVRDLPVNARERYTVTVRTGGKGWHLYYQSPAGLEITNSNKRCPPGIDVRAGDGAYVVAPPSRHISGRCYRFVSGREPWSIRPRTLPASLLPILTMRDSATQDDQSYSSKVVATVDLDSDHPYVSIALTSELDRLSQANEGNRNNRLNQSAFNLGQFVGAGLLSRSAIEELLKQAALALGLRPSEIEATIKSGIEAGINTPRNRWPDFGR